MIRLDSMGSFAAIPSNVKMAPVPRNCKVPRPKTSLPNSLNLEVLSSRPISNKKKTTPNSARVLLPATLPTKPKPLGPSSNPAARYPRIGEVFILRIVGTTTITVKSSTIESTTGPCIRLKNSRVSSVVAAPRVLAAASTAVPFPCTSLTAADFVRATGGPFRSVASRLKGVTEMEPAARAGGRTDRHTDSRHEQKSIDVVAIARGTTRRHPDLGRSF
mmetsp:Transcript_18380/g.38446  ORF Transcript_18380/g.38446 Transcript_18380/m.38446 type:complete len:218 (-) Transcript_18380:391-1044(-)